MKTRVVLFFVNLSVISLVAIAVGIGGFAFANTLSGPLFIISIFLSTVILCIVFGVWLLVIVLWVDREVPTKLWMKLGGLKPPNEEKS